jgi:hypothetical protein
MGAPGRALPQAVGALPNAAPEPDYVDPYAEQIAAMEARVNAPVAPMFSPEEISQRRADNSHQYDMGLLGQLSGDESLGQVGGQLLKQALAGRNQKVTERGVADPLTGIFKEDPEYQRQRMEQQLAGMKQHSAGARAAWNERRQRAEEQQAFKEMMGNAQAGGAAERRQGVIDNRTFNMGTKLRGELQKRMDKVNDGLNHARNVQQALMDPSIARDPTRQVALVFSFGKMLDPESVVRESEYALIANARGAFETFLQTPDIIMRGTKLTDKQLASMRQIASQFLAGGAGRVDLVKDQYKGIASRHNIPLEDVLPFEAPGPGAGGQRPPGIDVGAALGVPASGAAALGPGMLPQTTGRLAPQRQPLPAHGAPRTVNVEY